MAISTAAARDILNAGGGPRPGSANKPGVSPNADIPVTSWYLEFQDAELHHNKFYLCLASDAGHCLFIWGRIGSAGQSKVEKFPSFSDAEAACERQFHAKAAKGYQVRDKATKFTVKASELDRAMSTKDHAALLAARRKAKQDPKFTGQQQTATRHYDTFIEAAEALMGRAAKVTDAFALLDEWTALQEAWGELDNKHATAATTLALTGQMLQQKLFS